MTTQGLVNKFKSEILNTYYIGWDEQISADCFYLIEELIESALNFGYNAGKYEKIFDASNLFKDE